MRLSAADYSFFYKVDYDHKRLFYYRTCTTLQTGFCATGFSNDFSKAMHCTFQKKGNYSFANFGREYPSVVYSTLGQFLRNLFAVPKKHGGARLVIKLKEMNQFFSYRLFKMEGIHLARYLLQHNDWLGKIDPKTFILYQFGKIIRNFWDFFGLDLLWNLRLPSGLHKVNQAGDLRASPHQHSSDYFPRRHVVQHLTPALHLVENIEFVVKMTKSKRIPGHIVWNS